MPVDDYYSISASIASHAEYASYWRKPTMMTANAPVSSFEPDADKFSRQFIKTIWELSNIGWWNNIKYARCNIPRNEKIPYINANIICILKWKYSQYIVSENID